MTDAPSANAAVLVIDLQTGMFNGVLEPVIHDAERLTERTRAVLAWARASGRPVAFVRHEGPPAIRWRAASPAGRSGRRSARRAMSRRSRRRSAMRSAIRRWANGSTPGARRR